jgi:ORF6N domain
MKITTIQSKIHEIRGIKVMLDFDLAQLYEVETRVLKQTVKRNSNRFPDDFMLILSESEVSSMVSQNVIPSKSNLGGSLPFAFTQEGIAMLSGLLRSKIAVETNISIMRAFVLLRQFALSHMEITAKLKELEKRYDQQFNNVAQALDYLLKKEQVQTVQQNRKKIGYK